MVRSLINSYFTDVNYLLIYLHRSLYSCSSAIIRIFTGAFLFNNGLELHYVLLFFGLEFGLRGFCCPYGYQLLNKLGAPFSILIASIFYMLFFVTVSQAETNLAIAFYGFIFHSIGGGIYYPFCDVLEAMYIKHDHNRGKQYTFGLICISLSSMIGVAIAGLLIEYSSFIYVAYAASAAVLLSVVPLFLLDKTKKQPHLTAKRVYIFMLSKKHRPYLYAFLGHQLSIVMKCLTPLYLFMLVGKFKTLAYLVVLASLTYLIVLILYGRYIDKTKESQVLNIGLSLNAISSIAYMTVVNSPFIAFIVHSYEKIAFSAYDSSFTTGIHKRGRRNFSNLLLFGTAFQMSLCYGELVTLSLFALLTYFIGTKIFYVVFSASIVGSYIATSYLKKIEFPTR